MLRTSSAATSTAANIYILNGFFAGIAAERGALAKQLIYLLLYILESLNRPQFYCYTWE